MTTNDTTAITALRHIAAGHDAVCTDCGWMGRMDDLPTDPKIPPFFCPQCREISLEYGETHIAAYALRQIGGDTK